MRHVVTSPAKITVVIVVGPGAAVSAAEVLWLYFFSI